MPYIVGHEYISYLLKKLARPVKPCCTQSRLCSRVCVVVYYSTQMMHLTQSVPGATHDQAIL